MSSMRHKIIEVLGELNFDSERNSNRINPMEKRRATRGSTISLEVQGGIEVPNLLIGFVLSTWPKDT